MVQKQITLDAWKKNNVFITAVQGEVSSRFLEIYLEDQGNSIDLTDKSVQIYLTKPDGNKIFNSATIVDEKKGAVILELTSEMSNTCGTYQDAEIRITSSTGKTLKIKGINFHIEKAMDDSAIESSSEYTALQVALGDVDSMKSHINSSSNPHHITTKQIGAISISEKATNGGIATLDNNGKLAQMPTPDDIGAISKSDKNAINGIPTLNSNGKLQASQLDTSNDQYKIKLLNLSEEVQSAISGTAPVISSVSDGSLTASKYADNSINCEKLSKDMQSLYVKTINLLDKTTIDEGHYYSNAGDKGSNPNFSCIAGTAITAGNTYTLYNFGSPYGFGARGVFRGDNNTVIGTIPNTERTVNTFIAPTGAVSCDINFWSTSKSVVSLVEGSIPQIDTKFNEDKIICADKSVSYSKLDESMNTLFSNNPNLLDKSKCQDGYRYISSNGSILASDTFSSIPDIPVTAGETYTVTNLGTYGIGNYHTIGCFYNSSGAFISALARTTETTYSFTAPENAVTMNINFATTAKETATMVHGTNINVGVKFADNTITTNMLTFSENGNLINLYNENDTDFVNNGYYNTDGILVSNNFYDCTGYIPVTPGECYVSTDTTMIVTWWNSDKEFVGGVSGIDYNNKGFVEAPESAIYMRVTFPNSGDMSLLPRQVFKSAIYPEYKEYDDNIIKLPTLIINESNKAYGSWKGKNWTSYGDSITAKGSWQPRVAEILGLKHTNLGVGGSTVCGTGQENYKCFWDSDRINDIKESNPDVITILGGTNDLYTNKIIGTNAEFTKTLDEKDKTNFKGAYSYLIETLLTWKKTLRIFILTGFYGNGTYNINSNTNLTWRDFSNASREIAEYYSLPVIDLGKELGINSINFTAYLSDAIHPKGYGGLRIAELVVGKLDKIRPL